MGARPGGTSTSCSGPGASICSSDARQALASGHGLVGYGLYLDLLEPLRRPDQWRCDGQLTRKRQRCCPGPDLASQA